jgi:hypothetical protein
VTELELIGRQALEIATLREELREQERVCFELEEQLHAYSGEAMRHDRAVKRVFAAASTGDMRRKLQGVYEAAMGTKGVR